jgi:arginine-tRNA-protein transferase
METLFRYVAEPSPCAYLHDQSWSLEYECVTALTKAEYLRRMLEGWRRFGSMLFRPACPSCNACRALRVLAGQFRPDRSQRRTRKANQDAIRLRVGKPDVSPAKLQLYDRYHAYQAYAKGWPLHPAKDAETYAESFVYHPFPVEEWCYYLGRRLVGVGYVDSLPASRDAPTENGRPTAGLSAIYFFYDPAERQRGLGTWHILRLIEEAVRRGLPYVYLGYYVAGCDSMEYKKRFAPNQTRAPDGAWRDFVP